MYMCICGCLIVSHCFFKLGIVNIITVCEMNKLEFIRFFPILRKRDSQDFWFFLLHLQKVGLFPRKMIFLFAICTSLQEPLSITRGGRPPFEGVPGASKRTASTYLVVEL